MQPIFWKEKRHPHGVIRRVAAGDLVTRYWNRLFADDEDEFPAVGKRGFQDSHFACAAQLLQMAVNTGTAFGRRFPVDEHSQIGTQEYLAS